MDYQNSTPKVTDEKEDAVVRIFYTYRGTPESDISVWYADGEFGNREEVPQPVATLDATHVEVKVRRHDSLNEFQVYLTGALSLSNQFLKQSGLCPKVDLWTFVMDPEKGRRPIYMDEFIETVIHDVEYEWSESLPKALTEWELIFPKGESWGIVQIIGCVDSPGPSIREIKKSPTV